MNVNRVNKLSREREALAIYALSLFASLRNNAQVPAHVRTAAQRIEDQWNGITAKIDEAMQERAA